MSEEENKPAKATDYLPNGAREILKSYAITYGVDAVAQGMRDICAEEADRRGVDATRLTMEQRREAKLWRFGANIFERALVAILDHGPGSGCK